MKARSTFTRILGLGAAGSLLAAAMLLGVPGSTHDSNVRDASMLAAPSPIVAPEKTAISARVNSSEDRESPAAPLPSPGAYGMVIGIDPETGTIGMPTYEQQQELLNMERIRLEHSDADLVPVYHADGSISLDLKGRFQEFATVRIDPSGKKTFQCVDGAENAERTIRNETLDTAELAPVTPAAPAPEER